jgi:hypothetical protein
MSIQQLEADLREWIARVEEMLGDLAEQVRRLGKICDTLARLPEVPLQTGLIEPKSQFITVAEFLLAGGNRPKSARVIVKATGISRSSLSQIIHRTHRSSFVSFSIPGYSRKKLWALSDEAAIAAAEQLREPEISLQADLFGHRSDLAGLKAVDCCAAILRDHGNEPMNALSMAREALARGYRGRSRGSEDEVLLTTAKSFWAALGRDRRFVEVRALVFALRSDED